jgi:uncharacterized membrane protein
VIAYLVAYAVCALTFLAADAVWLSMMGPRLYRTVLGPFLVDRPNLSAALAFYVIYVAGVVILAVAPALRAGLWRTAAYSGLVLGLVAYGTYDLTNQATLRLWTTRLTVIDMAWGGVLTAFAATMGYLAAKKFAG